MGAVRKALVTGGAGFIGSHLSRRLLNKGWKVFIVDNLSTGFKSRLPSEAEVITLDITSDDFVEYLPEEKFHAVFHLAGQSSGEVSFDDPVYDLKANCISTLRLLDWCLHHNIKRFIYPSSISVYGEKEKQPVKEDAVPMPVSFYGVGKLASESYARIYSGMGLNTTSLRLFNVYGPEQNTQNLRQGMISIYMAYLLKGDEILVKGSPDRFRDFIYIDDVIDVWIKCIDNPNTYGKTYNVASGVKTTVRELLSDLIKTFGYDPLSYPVKFEGHSPNDIFGIYADISAIKEVLEWEPRVSLTEGLKKIVSWAVNNKQNHGSFL